MDKLTATLTHVEKLLGSKPGKKAPAKVVKRRKAQASSAAPKVITATAETWESAFKLMALFQPNLRKLQKLINKGLLTPQEVSDAIVEALRGKGVSLHLTEAIKGVLTEALGGDTGDVIDVEPGVGEEAADAPVFG
jgi:deoxyribodipyrimidine photolyase-like uncharacterized protein